MNPKILLIYTGGTIGMKQDHQTGSLKPFDFEQIKQEMPELKRFAYHISTVAFDPIIDSSDMSIIHWQKLANIIKENYEYYDGFVILHGTDTMSYTASALSFMISNLTKPVILTGSQLPIGTLRTDGKENLITAIEIAAAQNKDGDAQVPEVAILFEDKLMRGNRTTKHNSEDFDAFHSYNYEALADIGIHIKYNTPYILRNKQFAPLQITTDLNKHVCFLKLFPGIQQEVVRATLQIEGLRGVVLETYGSGNAMTSAWFLKEIEQAIQQGITIINVTQCRTGGVNMQQYESGLNLQKLGVVSGQDMTSEAAITKLMHLLSQNLSPEMLQKALSMSLKGEISY